MSAAEVEGVPEGSVAVGNRVRLPRGAEAPFTVFINGVKQSEGDDYRVFRGEIVFSRPILKEKKLTGVRWLSMLAGIAIFPWVGILLGFYAAGDRVGINDFPEVTRVLTAFQARPAVARGMGIPARPPA